MKRDMDLLREILVIVEKNTDPENWVKIKVGNFSKKEISYHIKLLFDAGLIDADDVSDSEGIDWEAKSLTWDGHNFLEIVKKDNLWEKVKKLVRESGKEISIALIKEFLMQQT